MGVQDILNKINNKNESGRSIPQSNNIPGKLNPSRINIFKGEHESRNQNTSVPIDLGFNVKGKIQDIEERLRRLKEELKELRLVAVKSPQQIQRQIELEREIAEIEKETTQNPYDALPEEAKNCYKTLQGYNIDLLGRQDQTKLVIECLNNIYSLDYIHSLLKELSHFKYFDPSCANALNLVEEKAKAILNNLQSKVWTENELMNEWDKISKVNNPGDILKAYKNILDSAADNILSQYINSLSTQNNQQLMVHYVSLNKKANKNYFDVKRIECLKKVIYNRLLMEKDRINKMSEPEILTLFDLLECLVNDPAYAQFYDDYKNLLNNWVTNILAGYSNEVNTWDMDKVKHNLDILNSSQIKNIFDVKREIILRNRLDELEKLQRENEASVLNQITNNPSTVIDQFPTSTTEAVMSAIKEKNKRRRIGKRESTFAEEVLRDIADPDGHVRYGTRSQRKANNNIYKPLYEFTEQKKFDS